MWIAIYCDPGKDGFKFVPGSHKHEWPYHVEFRNKTSKPKIDISDDEFKKRIEKFETNFHNHFEVSNHLDKSIFESLKSLKYENH